VKDSPPKDATVGQATPHPYDVFFDSFIRRRRQSQTGKIVLKARELSFRNSRQGRSRYYLHLDSDAALGDWLLFLKDVRSGSGKHTHQGGLVIYVVKGQGYSVFNGVRLDWKAGDLLSLPVAPGGVEHQHFPTGDQPSLWVAFIYLPFLHATGSMLDQVEERPDWRARAELEDRIPQEV
jgi:hypothetical protein